jgi:uncharacterized protein
MRNTADLGPEERVSSESDAAPRSRPPRGPVRRIGGRLCIGKVAAPPRQEATSGEFYFWVPPDALVEKTQLVTCESEIAGRRFTQYAIVDEVIRQSGKHNMGGEIGEADGDLDYEPPFDSDGFTYAKASILRAEPPVMTPPRERNDVFLAGDADARMAYGADEIPEAQQLPIGLIKNGGDELAGPGVIDTDYLLGVNGGHLNVNGIAGRGTKSSFLLFVIKQMLDRARRRTDEFPSDPNPEMVVPIILNVKGFDLFFINRWSNRYRPAEHGNAWRELGVDQPQPFGGVEFFAPQTPGGAISVPTGSDEAKPYSWSLADVIERGFLLYLFSDEDTSDANFSALLLDLDAWLTEEKVENDGRVRRSLRGNGDRPKTFGELIEWLTDQRGADDKIRALAGHHNGTWGKLRRRLLKLLLEGPGVLRRNDQRGNPLDVAARSTRDPLVVDLNGLAARPALQRFVVATILRQLVDERTGPNRVHGLTYLIALDELNRFAPRGSRDPITRLIETVAAEMRSQGIILLGAQQQASKVSETVIENASIRVLGCSGAFELSQPIWKFLSEGARRKASQLPVDEKLVIQANFREPMHVRIPYPTWAMNPREATSPSLGDARYETWSRDDDIPNF